MKLSRREFLKTTAAISGVIGMGAGGRALHTLAKSTTAPMPKATEKKVVVFCPGSGCHQRCPLLVTVVDGRIAKAEAAPFAEQPDSTHACLKGLASAALPYYPNRLQYPMKRVGERGEGKWQRITWEEALDTVANKLKEARDKYGPQSVVGDYTWSSAAPGSGAVNVGAEVVRFGNLFGWTDPIGWDCDTGSVTADFFSTGLDYENGDPRDLLASNLIIVWGSNPAESSFRDMKLINSAREKGVPLIVIGPLFDPTAAKADWWIPIRRATDAALGLAMTQHVISKGWHDTDFLRRYTVGPLLVRDDNGLLLRESDIAVGGSKDKFVAWDEATGAPVVIEPAKFDYPTTLSLMGKYTAAGVACQPAFQKLVDQLNNDYTPEKAAEITGVPATTIRELTSRYVKAKPAMIYRNHGLCRYYNGYLSALAQMTLATVCGYVGKSGGGIFHGGSSGGRAVTLNSAPVQKATDSAAKSVVFYDFLAGYGENPPYPYKVWVTGYRNPIGCSPNPQFWLQKFIPSMDFIVNINIRVDGAAQYADILLPDATIFERITLSDAQDHLILSGPAIEPQYESRTSVWIWSEIAKRMGYGEHFQKSAEEYIGVLLQTESLVKQGITLEKLRESGGMLRVPSFPKEPYVRHGHKKFSTPTGRIEFYFERLVEHGVSVPVYKPSLESPNSPDPKYPLQYFACRKRYYMQSFLGDIPVLKYLSPEPFVDINPKDAEARGIKNGDLVEVFNARGHLVAKAQLSQMVPPGSVRTSHGPNPDEFVAGHYAELILQHATRLTSNPVYDIRYKSTKPWWKWAGGQADVLFDAAVDVRKYTA